MTTKVRGRFIDVRGTVQFAADSSLEVEVVIGMGIESGMALGNGGLLVSKEIEIENVLGAS